MTWSKKQIAEYQAEYYKKNKKEIAKYRKKNKKKLAEYQAEYYKKNKKKRKNQKRGER